PAAFEVHDRVAEGDDGFADTLTQADLVGVIDIEEAVRGLAEDLPGGVAEDEFGAAVPTDDAAFEVDDDHAVLGRLYDRAEAGVCLDRAADVGQVAGNAEHGGDSAIGAEFGNEVRLQVVAGGHEVGARFAHAGLPGFEDVGDRRLPRFERLDAGEAFRGALANELDGGRVVRGGDSGIHVDALQLSVEPDDHVRRALGERAELGLAAPDGDERLLQVFDAFACVTHFVPRGDDHHPGGPAAVFDGFTAEFDTEEAAIAGEVS